MIKPANIETSRAPATTVKPIGQTTQLIKRSLDICLSLCLLLLLSPLFVLLAVLIRLDTPGPVIFGQRRMGRNGVIFTMYKFRSMIGQPTEPPAGCGKQPNDPRLTRSGRLLRRFSLDELPQLLNVLKGEMSLVGPRPELPHLAAQYEPWLARRLAVPQGMTGWWQVNGRMARPEARQRLADDLFYIDHYSLWLDMRILWLTVPAVLRGEGAY